MLYRRIFERLLAESRSRYDAVASSMVRDALGLIKDSIDKVNDVQDSMTSVVGLDGKKIFGKEFKARTKMASWPIEISIQIIVQRARTQDSVIVVATGGGGEVTFQIKVLSKSGVLLPQHLSLIQARLYEAARHELEHLFQKEDPSIAASAHSFFEKPHVLSRRLAYYTHPQEIPAFVSGMYMSAKKLRKPFVEVLEDNLEKIRRSMEFRGNTPDQIEKTVGKIRKAWMSYAQTRYLVP